MSYNCWFRAYICTHYVILTNILMRRGENGELRVGVRRFARQPSNIPTSVISCQSMHLGVLATASHAVSTQTRFVVYYKPRHGYFCNRRFIFKSNAFTVYKQFSKIDKKEFRITRDRPVLTCHSTY